MLDRRTAGAIFPVMRNYAIAEARSDARLRYLDERDPEPDVQAAHQGSLLIECARRAFESRGFHGVKFEDVARDAGVTTPGLRSVFPSKEAMYLESMLVMPPMSEVDQAATSIGERILWRFLAVRRCRRNNEVILNLIWASNFRDEARIALRSLFERLLRGPLGDSGDVTDLGPRLANTASVLLGITLSVDVAHLEPLTSADEQSLIEWLAPLVDLAARGSSSP